jgi:hypothetical protein
MTMKDKTVLVTGASCRAATMAPACWRRSIAWAISGA